MRRAAFTLVEILLVIGIIAALATITFVAINPQRNFTDSRDSQRKANVNAIYSALELYAVENDGTFPNADGTPLPVVTETNYLTEGVDVSLLENNFFPNYLNDDVTQNSFSTYYVGVLASGSVIVGVELSDGGTFAKVNGGITQVAGSGGPSGPGGPTPSCNASTDVLYIHNDPINPSDSIFVDTIENIYGYQVTTVADTALVLSDANDAEVIVISSTILSNNVNTLFRDAPIPILNWESALFDDFELVPGNDYGNDTGQSQIIIENNTHPITSGFNLGALEIYSGTNDTTWLRPVASGESLARADTADTSRKTIVVFELGDTLDGGFTAAEKRVAFFPRDNSASNLTTGGFQLFENALEWLTDCDAEESVFGGYVPPAGPANYCEVNYTVSSQWATGFNVDVTIENISPSAITGWDLEWTFPGNQNVSSMWNASYAQSGQDVTASNFGYNATINANGGTQSFGFQATYSGSNAALPSTAFFLNGTQCQ